MKTSDSPVALITGVSSGIGLLAAVELARSGYRVFGTVRDLARATRLTDAARAANVEVETVKLDLTDTASIDAAVREVLAKAGRIDVLVNNAGYGIGGFFDDIALDEFRAQFDTNFFGLISVIQAVLPGMRARKSGRIINISSIAGRMGNPGMSAYCASKFAVEGLSESLRLELLPLGIQVVLVEPGTFKTEIWERNKVMARRANDPASPNFERQKAVVSYVDQHVEKSGGDPMVVARAIVHAASAKAPRLRYLVGKDARTSARAKSLLPSKMFEKMVIKTVGLT
jgi:NAD(P)-dependent dehydrogenase (short-subunit alcohol dehydrogenase family)